MKKTYLILMLCCVSTIFCGKKEKLTLAEKIRQRQQEKLKESKKITKKNKTLAEQLKKEPITQFETSYLNEMINSYNTFIAMEYDNRIELLNTKLQWANYPPEQMKAFIEEVQTIRKTFQHSDAILVSVGQSLAWHLLIAQYIDYLEGKNYNRYLFIASSGKIKNLKNQKLKEYSDYLTKKGIKAKSIQKYVFFDFILLGEGFLSFVEYPLSFHFGGKIPKNISAALHIDPKKKGTKNLKKLHQLITINHSWLWPVGDQETLKGDTQNHWERLRLVPEYHYTKWSKGGPPKIELTQEVKLLMYWFALYINSNAKDLNITPQRIDE